MWCAWVHDNSASMNSFCEFHSAVRWLRALAFLHQVAGTCALAVTHTSLRARRGCTHAIHCAHTPQVVAHAPQVVTHAHIRPRLLQAAVHKWAQRVCTHGRGRDPSPTPRCVHHSPGGQLVSALEAMLIVSPKQQKRRRILPTMPVVAGPEWMPAPSSSIKSPDYKRPSCRLR